MASPLVLVCALLVVIVLSVRRRPRFAAGAALAALLLTLLASNVWIAFALTDYLESRHIPPGPLPPADAIVVLSSMSLTPSPPQPTIWVDDATINRVLYAVKLYREGKAPVVILSGGQFPWLKALPPMSESMSELIELMGVPKSAVIQESSSANTYEHAVDVKAILEARKLHKVLLVTSALHMSRALALFKHQGIDAIAAPCDFSSSALAWEANTSSWQALATGLIPDVANLTSTTKAIKEMVGIAVYRLMGLL